VRVHVACADVVPRGRVPEGGAARPGTTTRVQLRFESPAVVGRGDRLVLRSYSPAATLGGARVTDPLPAKSRRRHAEPTVSLEPDLSDVTAARRLVSGAGRDGIAVPTLAARVTAPVASLARALAQDEDMVLVGREPGTFVSRPALESRVAEVVDLLRAFHRANPLRAGMPREELRGKAFRRAPEGLFEEVVGRLLAAGTARIEGDGLALSTHAVRLNPDELGARDRLLTAAAEAGLAGLDGTALPATPPRHDPQLVQRVARVLLAEGTLRRVGDALVLRSRLDQLRDDVRARWPPGSTLDVAGFKELTGLTRKHVIPLLEYLDRERVTRRAGVERKVLESSPGDKPL
jgi:selenocysteine-specific elongation factor